MIWVLNLFLSNTDYGDCHGQLLCGALGVRGAERGLRQGALQGPESAKPPVHLQRPN